MKTSDNAHHTDAVLKRLIYSSRTRITTFRNIDVHEQGFVLLRLSPDVQRSIVEKLTDQELVVLLDYLDPDQATDVIQRIPDPRGKKVVKKLNAAIQEKTEYLLRFHPKTAAGMMKLDYILVSSDAHFGDVATAIKKHERRTGRIPTILVQTQGVLVGEIPSYKLALFDSNEAITKHIRKVHTVKYDINEKKVVDQFIKHPHNKVIVLDSDGSVIGVIHSDEILALVGNRSTRDLYSFAGVSNEEDTLDPWWIKVKFRYFWLIVNLATAFLAASVVGMFEDVIAKYVLLAIYMPVVAGMGGNAGTQSMAVAVRGLVLKELDFHTAKSFILNEMIAGAVNGTINGVIVALIATFINQSPMLGLVLGIAMVVNLVNAGFFGGLIPIIMKSLGKDPASSATIFITTATDVCGFFVFLSLARMLL